MGIVNHASDAARRKAQELLSRAKQADAERVETEAKRRQTEDAKTAQLKALRLAKEATDRDQRAAAGPSALRKKQEAPLRREAVERPAAPLGLARSSGNTSLNSGCRLRLACARNQRSTAIEDGPLSII
jgi:hypothetical protein